MPAHRPANFRLQEFTDVGRPLVGGRIYICSRGTTVQKIAFIDPDRTVPHTYTPDGMGGQYIALDSRGKLPAPLYLNTGSYDISLKRADGSTVWTRKADGVDHSLRSWMTAFASTLSTTLMGFIPTGAAAVSRTEQDQLRNTVSVMDFGAKGDGVTNDTDAFAAAAAHIMANSGGTLIIPQAPGGAYIVGKQIFAGAIGKGYAYKAADIINISGCTKPVVVESHGAVLRMAKGLKFGSFDPSTGAPHRPAMPFTNRDYAADVGAMLRFADNAGGVAVKGRLELDGNLQNLVIGGTWGDTGYQRAATGLHDSGNASFYAENVYTHHHATDGLYCAWYGAVADGPTKPRTLVNIVSEYNGRQAFSWVGGIGLTAVGCKFNRTGRAVNIGTGHLLVSSPASGLDIEASGAVIRNGLFTNCEFINNTNSAMVCDGGDTENVKFEGCRFGGVIWPRAPGFKFSNCKIHGPVTNPYGDADPRKATAFDDCLITDANLDDYIGPTGLNKMLFGSVQSKPVYMSRCAVNLTQITAGRLDSYVLTDCSFSFTFPGTAALVDKGTPLILYAATLRDCTIDLNVTANQPAHGYYVAIGSLKTSGINKITNTAGILFWRSWSPDAGGYAGILRAEDS